MQGSWPWHITGCEWHCMARALGLMFLVGTGATETIALQGWGWKTSCQEHWQVLLMERGGCSKGFVLLASLHLKTVLLFS